MSASLAITGTFARIFSFEASKKWIIREGLTGISRGGSGASIARGWRKSRGFLKSSPVSGQVGELPEPYKSKYADRRQAGHTGGGRAGTGNVRVAIRATGRCAAALGPRPGAGGAGRCDRRRRERGPRRRAPGRGARILHGLPGAELRALRAALLGGGPGGEPGPPLTGRGQGPARRGQGLGS